MIYDNLDIHINCYTIKINNIKKILQNEMQVRCVSVYTEKQQQEQVLHLLKGRLKNSI